MSKPKKPAAPSAVDDIDVMMQRRLDALKAEKDKVNAETAAWRAERDALYAEIEQRKVRVGELTAKIKAVEVPKMFDLSRDIADLAKALGARSVSMR